MINASTARLTINRQDGVATVTIDNPPVNVLDVRLIGELHLLLASLRDETEIRVIVFESADPEFFIAHVDMTLVDQPGALEELMHGVPEGLNPFQFLSETLRSQPQVTIVKLAGLARGGGAEFVAAADMAFAAAGRAGLAQCEALMGITPGGGGTQYLGERMTRGRALEAILGADLFDATTAERYGWINRALPADKLDSFVATLARNIAALEHGVVAAAKSALRAVDFAEGYQRESGAWLGLVGRPAAERLLRGGLRQGHRPGMANAIWKVCSGK